MMAAAQDRRPSHCIALADAPGIEYVHRAAFGDALEEYSVRLNYVAHATFLLETAGGLSVATDYTGFLGSVDFVPTVVTMNHAHDSHWTALPDERIPHVLKGWGDGRTPNEHHLDLGEMLVRNVPTDIRNQYSGGVEKYGNSIFVFEVAGLCIGHLGHLHHMPDDAQFAALGRLDVVMAPVDGGLTLDLPTMIEVLTRLRSSVVIPMHYWGDASLREFVSGMSQQFDIERRGGSSIELSLRTLPQRPTVITLRPAYLRASGE
ncbi:L-ascorbate metabolism protein UlaG (beta-lactamase superfamily) [Litoreibacter ponti]|uniref:L-ascorbate metabolism protein UlaG (Beta-lactamase superfamily) n=2 Tax=Litoreibacter ponti TaxID=1510457 RepID=A0A2T6BLN6_9RHOB|nr:L-ascorbate metabolism protein UlaG (beta-lactamase superfamily) [Litoreibacter ponti]